MRLARSDDDRARPMDGPTRGGKRRAGAKIHFKHLCEMADLRRELDQVRADYAERRSARPPEGRARACKLASREGDPARTSGRARPNHAVELGGAPPSWVLQMPSRSHGLARFASASRVSRANPRGRRG